MSKLPALVLSAALVLAGGAASAAVKDGTDGNDQLTGTSGKDTLRGKAGNDRLLGLGGDDLLIGGPGSDVIKGGAGLDDMGGGTGADLLVAGFDDSVDRLYGGPGSDVLSIYHADEASGGSGPDKIVVIDPEPGVFIQCGGGDDVVVVEGRLPAHTVTDGCEDVQPAG